MQFANLDEALAWLKVTMGEELKAPPALSTTSGPLILRTVLSEQGAAQAILLDQEQAGAEIEHFLQRELKSPVWKLLSAGNLLEILQSTKAIATERLTRIDQYLMTNRHALPQLTERPLTEVRPLLQQWLSVILDSDAPLAALSSRLPLTPAADIALLYGKLAESISSRYGLTDMATAEDYLLNARTLDSSMARNTIIPAMVERLGLTTEQLLAATATDRPPPDTLKTQLYSLLQRIERHEAQIPPPAAEGASAPAADAPSPQAVHANRRATEIETLAAMNRSLERLQELLKGGGPQRNPAGLPEAVPLRNTLQSLVVELQTLLGESREQLTHQLRAAQHDPELLGEALGRAREMLSRLADQLRQVVDGAVRQLQQLLSQSEALLEGDGHATGRHELLKSLRGEVEQFTRGLAREIAELTGRGTAVSDPFTTAPVKQQVETILQRIETLQVLAKPTPVAEGQQQILLLPLKIDNEWSEVSVQLIKKREKTAKKKGPRDYAVQIQVAPTFCGAVAVQMEYSAAGGLGVRINSEQGPTHAFFEANRPEITAALVKLGFKSVTLTSGTLSASLTAAVPAMSTDTTTDQSANIDIRV